MSEVKFTIAVDTVNNKITFTDNLTDWTSVEGVPDTLTIYLKGEDKDSYVVKKEVTDAADISLFQDTGLSYTYTELFDRDKPVDNFYLVEIVANESLDSQMLSKKMAVGFLYTIAEQVYNSTLGVHIPVEDLFTSMTLGMMPQSLELIRLLGLEAEYTYDREVKWRKLYNYLYTTVNELDY